MRRKQRGREGIRRAAHRRGRSSLGAVGKVLTAERLRRGSGRLGDGRKRRHHPGGVNGGDTPLAADLLPAALGSGGERARRCDTGRRAVRWQRSVDDQIWPKEEQVEEHGLLVSPHRT
ncbi:putative proline-rich receptor-like protein kinase PERK3 [Iris pallida]|uniref:Proline-rich receptor-like protein kinase PERK3 n=1 Tax=Iris pallida TaxID=29817 RepID=A0AAX6E9B8_IRIPA|nr:putative proline-rich receptor-like protein kinase PERK3 [Iris pallida]